MSMEHEFFECVQFFNHQVMRQLKILSIALEFLHFLAILQQIEYTKNT